jgi:hypothetical protein
MYRFASAQTVFTLMHPLRLSPNPPGVRAVGRGLGEVGRNLTKLTTALVENNGCRQLRLMAVIQDWIVNRYCSTLVRDVIVQGNGGSVSAEVGETSEAPTA